jgi:hypothetical protein
MAFLTEQLVLARQVGDRGTIAMGLMNIGLLAQCQGN